MQFNKFGRTGLSVSRLCLGAGTFGKQADEAESFRILDRAADAGVNLIDCADIYPLGGEAGRAEEITGRWLNGRHDRFIVTSKAGGPMGATPWDQGGSRKHLLDAIDATLKRMSLDYIDLYQLHADDPATPLDETAEAMDVIVRSGRARYIGVSNFLAYRLARAIGRQDTLRLTRFVSVQPRYNLLFHEMERELMPLAVEEGLAVIPYNPLAGGLLSGKYRRDETPTTGRFSSEIGQFGAVYAARYWREREFETIGKLAAIAKELAAPLPTLAIAWILANPAVTSAILGASRADQLTDTLAAANLDLSDATRSRLDDLTLEYRRGDATR